MQVTLVKCSPRLKLFKEDCENIEDITFFWICSTRSAIQAYYVEILNQLSEAVHRNRQNFVPMIGFSTTTMLQLTSSFWPKNQLL